jgi:hypothetical protein
MLARFIFIAFNYNKLNTIIIGDKRERERDRVRKSKRANEEDEEKSKER